MERRKLTVESPSAVGKPEIWNLSNDNQSIMVEKGIGGLWL